jgi:membrane protein YqaA with SNARE-associated domain
MLRRFYDWIMSYSSHPHAEWVLASVSFAESSFFPLPPDPLYMAMLIANRERTWYLATLCTVSSVVGGLLGYYIGYTLFESIGEWIIHTYKLEDSFYRLRTGFQQWGFWLVALKGLTPIPYKIVTITSGVAHLNLFTFTVASLIARGFRFYLLAGLSWQYGPAMRDYIERNLGLVTTLALVALVGGYWLMTQF